MRVRLAAVHTRRSNGAFFTYKIWQCVGWKAALFPYAYLLGAYRLVAALWIPNDTYPSLARSPPHNNKFDIESVGFAPQIYPHGKTCWCWHESDPTCFPVG